jgi:hypothetical protein
MRWSVALVAALVMAGCASKDDAPAQVVGIAATDLEAGNLTQTMFPLAFGGGTREADLSISETYAPTDACFFGFPDCVGAAERAYDLTPAIPAEVPVEMSIELTGQGSLDVDFELTGAQFIQLSQEENGPTTRIDATLVRSSSGTVAMLITFEFPTPDAAQGVTVEGSVHTVTRADVVPSFLPVALRLEPGDVVNATGDGLEHLVAFPPSGEPLRAVQYPFSLSIPEDAPAGTWVLIGDADEAIRLLGPNRTLEARLLEFVETPPVDVAPNQATSFTMDVPGFPLHAGIAFQSKPAAPDLFLSGVTVLGNHQVALLSPDRVDVISGSATCQPFCDFSMIGGIDGMGYSSGFLNEHLKAGTYEATVTMETSNDVQAYSFALYIAPA